MYNQEVENNWIYAEVMGDYTEIMRRYYMELYNAFQVLTARAAHYSNLYAITHIEEYKKRARYNMRLIKFIDPYLNHAEKYVNHRTDVAFYEADIKNINRFFETFRKLEPLPRLGRA